MAKGKVVQVIGTVVDVELPPGQLPELYNGLVGYTHPVLISAKES